MITAYSNGAQNRLRIYGVLALASFALILITISGCGGSARPQVTSITFTSDAAGLAPVCTTAITPDTPSGTLPCTPAPPATSLLPALTAGSAGTYLYANVVNDDQYLGVTWTLSCVSPSPVSSGSVNTACGTISPAQTLSGPVPAYPITGIVAHYDPPSAVPKGGTVIITAHATGLPSVASSVTLTITAAQSRMDGAPRAGAAGLRQDALLISDSSSHMPASHKPAWN